MDNNFVFCSYCSSLVFGSRCASCGAPVLQPKNFTIGDLRKSIVIQKNKDIDFDYCLPHDRICINGISNRGGFRL